MTASPGLDQWDLGPGNAPWAWRGAVGWTPPGHGWRPLRLLADGLEAAHAPQLIERAHMAAGVRLEVDTDAVRLDIAVIGDDETSPLDVVCDGQLVSRTPIPPGPTTLTQPLPPGDGHHVEVWLPQFGQVEVGAVTVSGQTYARPVAPCPRWVTYGSSITQGRSAAGPTATWPALVARANAWDLTNLGFGGQCHLDPLSAATLATQTADVVSLCLGINVFTAASFGPRTWTGQVSAFISSVMEHRPEVPCLVITPLTTSGREQKVNQVGMTLQDTRDGIAEAVATLRHRLPHLELVDGPEILGPSDLHLLGDEVHPTTEGYVVMAQRLGPRLAALLPPPTVKDST